MSKELTRIIVIENDTIDVGMTGEVPAFSGASKSPDAYNLSVIIYDAADNDMSHKWIKRFTQDSKDIKVDVRKTSDIDDLKNVPADSLRMRCYNKGLEEVKSGYILFSRPGVKAETECFNAAFEAIDKNSVDMVSYWPFQEVDGKRFNQIYFSDLDRVYDSYENPFHLSLTLDAVIINRESIGNIRFDEKVKTGEELFLIRVYDKVKKYYILREKVLITDYLPNDFYNYRPMYDKEYYIPELRDYYLPLLRERRESPVIQGGILELIQLKITQNANDRNKNIIMNEEVDEFFRLLTEALRLMDDEIIVQCKWTHRRTVPRFMSIKFLRLKYDDMSLCAKAVKLDKKTAGEAYDNPDGWFAECKGIIIERFDKAIVNFKTVNFDGNNLIIEGELANIYYADFDKVLLEVCFGKKRLPVERIDVYTHVRQFGKTIKKGYAFRVAVPVKELKKKDKIYFEYSYENAKVRTGIYFISMQSRLTTKVPECYWIFSNRIMSYDDDKKQLNIEPKTIGNHLRHEFKMMYGIAKHGRKKFGKKKVLEMLFLRMAVKLGRAFRKTSEDSIGGAPENKKPIWITYDQLFKGGDNGQYFYEYMNKNVKDIDTYYIINKDTNEYKELSKKYKTLLPFNTFKTRLKCLKADMLFATRIDIKQYMGFLLSTDIYVRDLFKAKVVCLQHGLTIQKIAQYQNRFYDNTKHYFCVSPKEVENIMKPIYGYTQDMITLTGAPRYDGLVGTPKKQILITPTWRRNVTAGTNEKGKQHEYSVNFKRTTYYKIYNSLINDKRLIDAAKKTGYRIIYLVHPILSPQAGDYDKNSFVDIVPGVKANYEKMLKESALMVTDYSGIQFDFAYMRRPLVYFHPAELPPQYDEEDTGFGPVCRTNDELVDQLIKAMENDCKLDENYKKTIDAFFPYNDQNACKRVYEAAVKL